MEKIKKVIGTFAQTMEPSIEKGTFVVVTGPEGQEVLHAEEVELSAVQSLAEKASKANKLELAGTCLENLVQNKHAWSIEVKEGFAAYATVKGYVDHSDMVIFDSDTEASEYLSQTYPELF